MAEEYSYRIEYQDLTAADLILQAEVGEGFIIDEIGISTGQPDLISPVFIGDTTMLCLPADDGAVHICPVGGKDINQNTLFATLLKKYPDIPLLKVPSGKTLKIPKIATSGKAYVQYRKVIGDQVPAPDAAGAPYGYPRLFISHSRVKWSVPAGATEYRDVTENMNPAGLIGFPAVGDVPAGYIYDLIGLATWTTGVVGTNITHIGIRIWKLEKSLLAKDEAWIDPSLYPYNRNDIDKPFFTFPKPISFVADETCKIQMQVKSTDAAPQVATVYVTTFWIVKKAGV